MAILVQSNKKPSVSFPSQTGSIVTFNSQYAGLPLKSCKVNIPVTQEGTGDPSPDNVRNFIGVDSLDFTATGVNLWGGTAFYQPLVANGATLDTTEKTVSYSGAVARATGMVFDKFKPNTQYTLMLHVKSSNRNANMVINYTDGTNRQVLFGNETGEYQYLFTTPNTKSVRDISFGWISGTAVIYYDTVCLLEGVKTADDFVPFGNNKLFTFGQTIYAGELDVLTGIFTATHKIVDLGSLTWNRYTNAKKTYFSTASEIADCVKSTSVNTTFGLYCSSYIEGAWTRVIDSNDYENQFTLGWANHSYIGIYDPNKTEMTVEDFKTAMTGIYLLYPLATPEVINLGGMDIETLQGENNLFASTGDTTASHIKIGG